MAAKDVGNVFYMGPGGGDVAIHSYAYAYVQIH